MSFARIAKRLRPGFALVAVFAAAAIPTYAIAAGIHGGSTARPELKQIRIQSPAVTQLARNVPVSLRRPQHAHIATGPRHAVTTPASLRKLPIRVKP